MNATLIKHEFHWDGNEDDFDEKSVRSNGDLVLYFSNGVILEISVFHNNWNGIFLRSPYTNGEMIVTIYTKYPSKQTTSFYITKSYCKIEENGVFIKKFTKLKYWIYIKSRHSERKKLKELLATTIGGLS
jgi:hypothetical protein